MRSHLNRVIVVLALLLALPAVALVARVHCRAGRRLAVWSIRSIARACGVRVEVSGCQSLKDDQAYVLVPNHSSPVDIGAVLMAQSDVQFVAAQELFRIPLLESAMRALGTVPISRTNRSSAAARVRELSRPVPGRKLVVFAEGGISPTGDVLPFKSGAFVVAIETAAEVVPVAISGAAAVLPRGARLKVNPGTIRIALLPPLLTQGLTVGDRRRLASSARDSVVSALQLGQSSSAA